MAALGVLAFVLAVGYVLVLRYSRSREHLETWARREGHRLRQADRAWFWRGPFWLRSNQGQDVFRIRVQDENGRARSGYARVGGWFLGFWSDEVVVKWDERV